ncbi:plastocyanin/azurin family copper-binding protein [Halovenus halobia]|uniref:plastocyanin/azurin family copper-binding protein n=1 Tax=Halovenus halobia TaxID=3396622 RepID=UPI003F578B0F
MASIQTAVDEAYPGDSIELASGEYREEVWTTRAGESGAPITITGPEDAVIRPPAGSNDVLRIRHSHIHVRGMTIDGLLEPDRKYEDYGAWVSRCVFITPVGRYDAETGEGPKYLYDVVLEPSQIGNCAKAMVKCVRLRDSSIGDFEVIGPAGMRYDPRVDNYEIGHVRELVYVGSPETHRGESYYKYETLDRSQNIRVHHIDNSAGYRHNELVDVKLGSSNITIEYCTTRNAGHNTEAVVNAAIDLKGNDCTVRWNDIGDSPVPLSFGAWAPSDDIDGGDWSQNNDIYGNYIHDFAAGPFRMRNDEARDVGPVSFDEQSFCGNRIERGSPTLDHWVGTANGYDGTLVDKQGQDSVTIDVGAGTDERELDPPAVVVDPGTTVTWEWVGTDEHYILRQERVRDDPSTVPDLKTAEYSESKTLDQIGVYRYACYNHHDQGMRGTVIVRDDESRWDFTRAKCDDVSVTATGDTIRVNDQAEVSIAAEYTDQITIRQLWTDWTVESGVSDQIVTDRVSTAGEYELGWDVRQLSPQGSITIRPPDRYVGGEYELTIIAKNAYGETKETTVPLTIDSSG